MEYNLEYIERYFSGELRNDELLEFEKQLSENPKFAQEVELYGMTKRVIQKEAQERLKKQLDEIGKIKLNSKKRIHITSVFSSSRFWFAAASIILLLVAAYFSLNIVNSERNLVDPELVYEKYFEIPNAEMALLRSVNLNDSLDVLWNIAILAYNEQDFEAATHNFNLLLFKDEFKYRSTAHFYQGICYLHTNLNVLAIENFRAVSVESSFSQDAQWYIGLTFLKIGNITDAYGHFEEISKLSKHYKKKEVLEIMKLLSKIKN